MKRFLITSLCLLTVLFSYAAKGICSDSLSEVTDTENKTENALLLISKTQLGLPVGEEVISLNNTIFHSGGTCTQKEIKRIQRIQNATYALHNRLKFYNTTKTDLFRTALSFAVGLNIYGRNQMRC